MVTSQWKIYLISKFFSYGSKKVDSKNIRGRL
jgi:hypothetical protein